MCVFALSLSDEGLLEARLGESAWFALATWVTPIARIDWDTGLIIGDVHIASLFVEP